jgi:hypothetical protein
MPRNGRVCTRCRKALPPKSLLLLPDGRSVCERCARTTLPAEDFKRLMDTRIRYS